MASLQLGLAGWRAAAAAAAASTATAAPARGSSTVYVCRTGGSSSNSTNSSSRRAPQVALATRVLQAQQAPADRAWLSTAPMHAAAGAAAATAAAAAAPPLAAAAAQSRPSPPGGLPARPSGGSQSPVKQQQQNQQEQQEQQQQEQQRQGGAEGVEARRPLCLSDDAAGAAALAAYSTPELYRSLLVFTLCGSDRLVQNSERLFARACRLLGPRLTSFALKHTFFKVFCGGEDLHQLEQTLDKLQQRKFGAVLDFAAEQPPPGARHPAAAAAAAEPAGAADPFETVLRRTRETISVASARGGGYAALKVSSLGDPEDIQRFSSLLQHIDRVFGIIAGIEQEAATGRPCPQRLAAAAVSKQQFVSALTRLRAEPGEAEALFEHLLQQPGGDPSSSSSSSDGNVSYFQWSHAVTPATAGHEGPMRCLSRVLPVLNTEDLAAYKATRSRFLSLCDFAQQQPNPPMLLVDAEQSTLQPFIHSLALEAQKIYNTEAPALGSTYQAYLKDTLSLLTRDLELARRFGITLSVKLVRGAYVNFERKLAEETGEAPLIHDCIQDTHDCYNACVRLLFANLDIVVFCCLFCYFAAAASHNTESLEKAAELLLAAERKGASGVSGRVAFGQLYGMCDAASHGLAAAGFPVFKYLPFGPVEETVPYLIRRVQENGGVMGGARREVRSIVQEIRRRAGLGGAAAR
ncbi:hypothetical protein Efla_004969 [Eimeria flavescens]